MNKFLHAIKWKIFRKRHIYLVHYTTVDTDEYGVEHVVDRSLTMATTMSPRILNFNTLREVLRRDDNNETIEIKTYNYQGKW